VTRQHLTATSCNVKGNRWLEGDVAGLAERELSDLSGLRDP
jgi:hypothetical protein